MLYVTCLSLLTLLMRAISGAYVEKRQHGPEERQFQNYGDVVISTAAQTDVGIPYGEAYNSVPGGGPIMISDDPGAAPSTVQNPSVITPPPGSPIHQACTGNALVSKIPVILCRLVVLLIYKVCVHFLLAPSVIKHGLPRYHCHAHRVFPQTTWNKPVSPIPPYQFDDFYIDREYHP